MILQIDGVVYDDVQFNKALLIPTENGFDIELLNDGESVLKYHDIPEYDITKYEVIGGEFSAYESEEQQMKQIRADIDYIAMMGGVDLDVR